MPVPGAVESEGLQAARRRVLGAAAAGTGKSRAGEGVRREVLGQLLNVTTLLRAAARWSHP